MNQLLGDHVASIGSALESYFDTQAGQILTFHPWGEDLRCRLRDFTLRGKLLRGALVPFTFRLFSREDPLPSACLQAGVAMELLQAFLLIHDDIMDQDKTRRGAPAVHAQYEEHLFGKRPEVLSTEGEHYGVAQGICAGDVAAFLAMQIISGLEVIPETRVELVSMISREIVAVGLAQMQDVHHGAVSQAEPEKILEVYTGKTGRYTFSLPMMIGARLAGQPDRVVQLLQRFGESQGRIFQIRDDQLGIFGDSQLIGKPLGSDIRENKKTLFREELFRRLPQDHPLRDYFGSDQIGPEEVEKVRQALHEEGVMDVVEEQVARDREESLEIVERLSLSAGFSAEGREALEGLVSYNLGRTR
ncbi:geranylgeranyl diphosphate synthase, type I [Alkalispirochaeta americana]|uniref:Geranylgeranyl diphosphate synthase, type I n=1 Tax=Alkalispirochaeta americana TaxID=159291 RepID=A0A1N6P1N6_9SPIO|nr:polyprenyl synthetase family protein [Alkalispirochaeta americana]SIP98167.1 geranylgeranyl diphosphate synthase, type I [Alkalispirochaeta americana]